MRHFSIYALFFIFLILSCSDEGIEENIVGTYYGTLQNIDPSQSDMTEQKEGFTLELKKTGDLLQATCYGQGLTYTFMLEYYEHNGVYKLCLEGNDYFGYYGSEHRSRMNGNHHMNQYHQSHTPWMRHLDEFHDNELGHENGMIDPNGSTIICSFYGTDERLSFKGRKK